MRRLEGSLTHSRLQLGLSHAIICANHEYECRLEKGLPTLPKEIPLQKQYVGSSISITTSFFVFFFSFFAVCCVRFVLPLATFVSTLGFDFALAAGFSVTLTATVSSFSITGERLVQMAERAGWMVSSVFSAAWNALATSAKARRLLLSKD
jgi:hypothetical protein